MSGFAVYRSRVTLEWASILRSLSSICLRKASSACHFVTSANIRMSSIVIFVFCFLLDQFYRLLNHLLAGSNGGRIELVRANRPHQVHHLLHRIDGGIGYITFLVRIWMSGFV